MNIGKEIDFYYFSGTGNTFLVVERMKKVFLKHGVKVTLKRIEVSDPEVINLKNTIGLAFPVAGFSTFKFIWNFIKNFPKADNTPIFMVDTLAGFSGGVVGPLRKLLEEKGFVPLGAMQIIMPSNIFYIYPDIINKMLITAGIKRAEKYAETLISGRGYWQRFPFISDVIYFFYENLIRKGWESKWNQKYFKFRISKTKCNKCFECIQMCPVDNITAGDYPVIENRCEFCMRCVSWCKERAIICCFNFKGKIYRADGLCIPYST